MLATTLKEGETGFELLTLLLMLGFLDVVIEVVELCRERLLAHHFQGLRWMTLHNGLRNCLTARIRWLCSLEPTRLVHSIKLLENRGLEVLPPLLVMRLRFLKFEFLVEVDFWIA